jgi:hypothetical protein
VRLYHDVVLRDRPARHEVCMRLHFPSIVCALFELEYVAKFVGHNRRRGDRGFGPSWFRSSARGCLLLRGSVRQREELATTTR